MQYLKSVVRTTGKDQYSESESRLTRCSVTGGVINPERSSFSPLKTTRWSTKKGFADILRGQDTAHLQEPRDLSLTARGPLNLRQSGDVFSGSDASPKKPNVTTMVKNGRLLSA